MAQEIYYTSSPRGLRPGDRGFCTVAATDSIGRALAERLEAMSGYRHPTEPGAAGFNPVCHAHWILRCDGRDYHVLSRICDAGLDFTQRSNSFSHHLALEDIEMSAAGPAWLLGRPEVMLQRWDGQVGPIARAGPLPSGLVQPAPCLAWQAITGDAGWAGVVADSLVNSPWKVISLLFQPGQEMLPLVAETLALLPPALRWQATFNTYFTSLPGGVTCQWRCCLAGGPAAAVLQRGMASGVVTIDLTRGRGLGSAPGGPWVAAARAGLAGAVSARASVGAAPPGKVAAAAPTPAGPPPLPEQLQPVPLAPSDYVPSEKVAIIRRHRLPPKDLALPPGLPVAQAVSTGQQPWIAARRRRIMSIYILACAALAGAVLIAVYAHLISSVGPLPPSPPTTPTPAPSLVRVPSPPKPVVVPPRTTIAVPPAPIVAAPPKPVEPATTTAVPAPPEAAIESTPPLSSIAFDGPLPVPKPGNGLTDTPQPLLPASPLKDIEPGGAMQLSFPQSLKDGQVKLDELEGQFTTTAVAGGFELDWRGGGDLAGPQRVLTVAMDAAAQKPQIIWSSAMMMRRPEVSQLAYWVLQNSAIHVQGAGGRMLTLTWPCRQFKSNSLVHCSFGMQWPDQLPSEARLKLTGSSPDGWKVANDVVASGVQSLTIQKGDDAAAPAFTLRFSPTLFVIDSDISKLIDAATADLQAQQDQLKHAEADERQVRDTFAPGTTALQQSIDQWTTRQQAANRDPQRSEYTDEQCRTELERLNKNLQAQQSELDAALAPSLALQRDARQKAQSARETLDSYEQLETLDLTVELPQDLLVGTLSLQRGGPIRGPATTRRADQ